MNGMIGLSSPVIWGPLLKKIPPFAFSGLTGPQSVV